MSEKKLTVIILAAGQSKRIKSKRPKVLHPLLGRPMVWYVVDIARQLGAEKPILVIRPDNRGQFEEILGEEVTCVEQAQPLGTGHAVLQARHLGAGICPTVLVLYGDTPLLRPETLRAVLERHKSKEAALTILTFFPHEPGGYGRILRDGSGQVTGIVEYKAATPDQQAIREVNSGVFFVRDEWLWPHLEQIKKNEQGEYYLTDLVEMAISEGEKVEALPISDPAEPMGINNRVELAEAEAAMRHRINERHMLAGVTLVDPATTYIEPEVEIEPDTVIYPNTYLQGQTRIGPDCKVGPCTIVRDSAIGARCIVELSVVEEAVLEDEVEVGPFAHLRKGAHLGRGTHMGNFGEVKNSYIGPGTKMGHFGYVGDAKIGENVNIGAGTVTCNYDGQRKHRTVIEDGAFIGSDTMLVAPVTVGAGAVTGAGSVVTRDVPPKSLAYGVPARIKKRL